MSASISDPAPASMPMVRSSQLSAIAHASATATTKSAIENSTIETLSGPVSTGQVIGLIEAMKLFNEIKSDITGIVRHIAAGDGDLVKAHQTLIEVEPT